MENYHIVYDSYFDSFFLFLFGIDECICDVDSCRSDDVDRLRYWLSEFPVSYIDPLAEERLRDSI